MGLIQHFEEDRVAVGGNVLDWPALVLSKILMAIPSRYPFHIQCFLGSWNADNRVPRLQSNDDLTIADGILRQLPLSGHNNIPALTQYLASFDCLYCGHRNDSCHQWNEKAFSVVPSINVPHSSRPISIEILLRGLLDQRMRITCPECGQLVTATWKVVKGLWTVLYLSRANHGQGLVRSQLQTCRNPPPPLDILGELVSLVSRCADDEIGGAGGHFISYHHTVVHSK